MAKKKSLKKFTKKIIVGDTFLNWFLGFMLVFYPYQMQAFFTSSVLFKLIVWRILGAGFILFAAFQTYHVFTKINKFYYLVAMWAAIIPVLILTIYLFKFNDLLYQIPKIIAWTGNIYMVWISWLYYKLSN